MSYIANLITTYPIVSIVAGLVIFALIAFIAYEALREDPFISFEELRDRSKNIENSKGQTYPYVIDESDDEPVASSYKVHPDRPVLSSFSQRPSQLADVSSAPAASTHRSVRTQSGMRTVGEQSNAFSRKALNGTKSN